jgi:hypothetical protein
LIIKIKNYNNNLFFIFFAIAFKSFRPCIIKKINTSIKNKNIELSNIVTIFHCDRIVCKKVDRFVGAVAG